MTLSFWFTSSYFILLFTHSALLYKVPPPPHTHPTLPFCPYLQSSACNSELISSFQIRTRSVELTLKNLWHQSFIAFTSLEQCAESLLTTSMLKKSQLMTIGKSGQGWMTVLHSDMEKQYWRVFPPHNCCQVSSETDRETDVKKEKKKGRKFETGSTLRTLVICH